MGLWQISPRKCTLGNMECCFLSLSFKMILLPFLHTGFTLVWILMTFVSTFQSLSFDVLSLLLFSLNSFQETKKRSTGPNTWTLEKHYLGALIHSSLFFFAKTFAFAEKYCQSVLGGAIFLLQRQPSFFAFFQTHTKVVIIKRDFAPKQQKGNF